MGVKAKKAMKKNLKKASSQLPVSSRKDEALDFLVMPSSFPSSSD
jgi:hypothetical protein